ncbi:fungal-specific transcription factor domain-containing protein [Xylogone sp. PMI_703]|nr:fungal-specific transcription factor domain-containing protein [Xylogone sp. PMI_703]
MQVMATSDSTSPTTTTTARVRQRVRRACLCCRQRKRKCDSTFPCEMCRIYGYKCEYSTESRGAARRKNISTVIEPAEESSGHVSPVAQASVHGRDNQPNLTPPRMVSHDSPSSPPSRVGILDPVKSRYMSRHSAIAFPRSLGIDLQSSHPPPLHSFAYNCGVRPEAKAAVHGELLALISIEEIHRFVQVYFSVVNPMYAILDQEPFLKRLSGMWNAKRDVVFESIVAGVVSLGSFFSLALGHPREADLVHYAKSILEDPSVVRVYTIDHVVASFLRTVYLRATTRPHVSWMQSCNALHLAEAAGLHHESHALILTTDNSSDRVERNKEAAEQARRVFWLAWAIHTIMSYEYGRSAIILSSITCNLPQNSDNHFITIAQLLPEDRSTGTQEAKIYEALDQLLQIPDSHPMICLTKADACFCFYRRLYMSKSRIAKQFIDSLIELGNTAIEAAHALAQEARPWWHVLGIPFQFICILIAIDKSNSLMHMTRAVETLEKIARLLGTHLALEALSTAKLLMSDSAKKKRMELKLLDEAHDAIGAHGEAMIDLDTQIEFNWDELFQNEMYSAFPSLPEYQNY